MKDEIKNKRKDERLGGYFANTQYAGMYRDMRGGAKVCPEGYEDKPEICGGPGSIISVSGKPCFKNEDGGICVEKIEAPAAAATEELPPPPPDEPPPESEEEDETEEEEEEETEEEEDEGQRQQEIANLLYAQTQAPDSELLKTFDPLSIEDLLKTLDIDQLREWAKKENISTLFKSEDTIKRNILENYYNKDIKCEKGIYNLNECNTDNPCRYKHRCIKLTKIPKAPPAPPPPTPAQQASPSSETENPNIETTEQDTQTETEKRVGFSDDPHGILRGRRTQAQDTLDIVDDDNPLSKQLKNIDFSEIESKRNNIERRINSIRTDDDKYEVERKIAQYNRDYELLKNKISLIKRTIRAKNLSDDDEIITELNDKNEKLLYYESYTTFFRNIINSIKIKDKRDSDDRKRDDGRYRDDRRYDDRRRDDRRDPELNRRLQEYEQGQKGIDRLSKEIGQERPQQRPQVMPQQPQGLSQQQQIPGERPQQQQEQKQDIDPRKPKMTFKQRRGIDRREPRQPRQPGQQPKRLKDIDREKYVFERKGQEGKIPRRERLDVRGLDKRVENKYVPDVRIDKYAVNDLMHILKDVKHSDKDKFYNILNNEYLYRNSNIDEYLLNIDNYLLDRYRLFMERLSKDNTEEEKLAIIQLLTEVNQKPDIRKRKTINKRNK